jgi:ribosomal protein S18 acetylase RimI-like enzyme
VDELLTLRPATEADVPFLLDLRARTMAPHFLAAGRPQSEETSLERVRRAFDRASLVLLAGRPVGLLKAVREGERWELLQIQLAPEAQGRGIGTRLVRALVEEARAAGAALRLGVLKVNPARRLYERLGFVIVGESEIGFEMELAPVEAPAP